MLSSAETVCANSARVECRLPSPPAWITGSIEEYDSLQMRLRAVVWGVSLSALLWGSFFLAGRTLLRAWR
jgi:hypothetical protein